LKELEEKKRLEILERQKLVEKKKQQIEMEREKWLEESKVRAAEREMTIRRVLDFNRTLEEERIAGILKKNEETEKRLFELQLQKEKDLERKRLEEEEKEAKRALTIQRAEELELARKEALLERQFSDEEALRRQKELLRKQFELKQEERRLREQEKKENVERLKRIEDFQRSKQLEKIRQEDERLVQQRKQRELEITELSRLRTETSMQRTKIRELLERMRITKSFDVTELNRLLGSDSSYVMERLQNPRPSSSHSSHSLPSRVSSPSLFRQSPSRSPSRNSVRSQSPTGALKRSKSANRSISRDNGSRFSPSRLSRSSTPTFSSKSHLPSKFQGRVVDKKEKLGGTSALDRSRTDFSHTIDLEDTIYEYRQRQNDELLEALKEERERELEREKSLNTMTSEQLQHMNERFKREREAANAKIIEMVHDQDEQLSTILNHHHSIQP